MVASTKLQLKIDGMHCDACVRRVKNSLAGLPGVHVEHVEIGTAKLKYDPSQTNMQAITTAVGEAGFEAQASA